MSPFVEALGLQREPAWAARLIELASAARGGSPLGGPPLALLADPTLVAAVLAQALGLGATQADPLASVKLHLRDKPAPAGQAPVSGAGQLRNLKFGSTRHLHQINPVDGVLGERVDRAVIAAG